VGKNKMSKLSLDGRKCHLSIIIPSYKREILVTKIKSEIESLFKSVNFYNYEIITIESGCESLKNKEKLHLKYKRKLSPGVARNLGLGKASGEYIWFVDDDDALIDDVEILKSFLLIIQKRKADIFAHSLKTTYSTKRELLHKVVLFKEKQEAFNYVFRKSLLEKHKISFNDGLHEDIPFVVKSLIKAKKVLFIDSQIYIKNKHRNSITSRLTEERIDGYINSIRELTSLKNISINSIKKDISMQGIGVVLYLINQETDVTKHKYLEYLRKILPTNVKEYINIPYKESLSNFKLACASFSKQKDIQKLINDLKFIFNTHLSCRDLKNSIFLGPSEVIGCCKRFFYKGKIKGDIILMPAKQEVNLQRIKERKKQIENEMTAEDYEDCVGCPYIQRFENNLTEKINYISIENFSFCNMKCTYCSPKYYGGREAEYDTEKIINDLKESNLISPNLHVVYGGGEPTLSKKFKEITGIISNDPNLGKMRILSNSLRYSENLEQVLDSKKACLVTSIDAGTNSKFTEIRGKGEIEHVLKNLRTYSKNGQNSTKITIKYIFTDQNYESNELIKFVQRIREFQLEKCFFQISCNFKTEVPSIGMILAFYELAGRLLSEKIDKVYFDDLIRDRLRISNESAERIKNHLNICNILHANMIFRDSHERVVLWGKGRQADWIKNHTLFGRSNGIVGVVENEHELNKLNKPRNFILCPAGVQSVPDIYEKIYSSAFQPNCKFLIFI
jgi:organic radical activating enzyme/glycosyltransferase involved in cell wall biosynthesis